MIVKRTFHPLKIWAYIKGPVMFSIAWSTAVWCIYHFMNIPLQVNFTPIGVLGSALAIFIAFRNNSAYGRWWEARKIWGGIVNSSRVLSRLVITFTDSHSRQENYERQRSERFKKSMVLKCIAWVHALRFHLRKQDQWHELANYLSPKDFEELRQAQNKPNYLQLLMGREIYEAMGNGTLGGFDSFQMEGQLLALANYQGAAERIKNTPLPRQYDFFTRLFVLLFSALLPFGLLSFFQVEATPLTSILVVPFSVLIATVFVIMERTGAANEDPFENQITDVPLSTLCNTIERDLLEVLGSEPLPPKMKPENGYLF